MKRLSYLTLAWVFSVLFLTQVAHSQVKGISYTLAPLAEYHWANDKSGLDDGFLGGAQLGFGFGEYVELRGLYLRSLDLDTELDNFGINFTDLQNRSYNNREVLLQRYGGELKLNLGRGALSPYATVGTGIQELELVDFQKNKNIYYSAGLGIKVAVDNRYTFGIEGTRTTFSSNGLKNLMTDGDRTLLDVTSNDFDQDNLSNYALRASLLFYIGGRKPGTLSEIDQAYVDNFSGGFRGLSIPIEPTVMRMDFHDDLRYRDATMFGGSAGINIGPLVGVRGFYWHALEKGSASKFDNLYMYGGEGRFKLNEGKGFVPWITLGGGEIRTGNDYLDVDSVAYKNNEAFAMGGVGLDLPFSKYIKMTGYVRSILTSSKEPEDVTQADDINASWAYGVSLNFVLGKQPKKTNLVQQEAFDDYILSTKEEHNAATEKLKREYDKRIAELELQLDDAIESGDAQEIKKLNNEKNRAEDVRSTLVENDRRGYNDRPVHYQDSRNQISREDIRDAVRDVMHEQNRNQPRMHHEAPAQDVEKAIADLKRETLIQTLEEKINDLEEQIEELEEEVEEVEDDSEEMEKRMRAYETELKYLKDDYQDLENDLEKSAIRMETMRSTYVPAPATNGGENGQVVVNSVETKLLEKDIEHLNRKISDLQKNIDSSIEEMNTNIKNNTTVEETIEVEPSNVNYVKTGERMDRPRGGFWGKLRYNGMSGFAGFGLGKNTTFNLGYRLHYDIEGKKNLHLMPETFFGLGDPSNFGISLNGIYDLKLTKEETLVKPYVGLGVGLMKVGSDSNKDQLKGAFNIILGTSLNVWRGDLYVDLTGRNLFKYNQLAVGYRFPF